ncbi:hypothetical protein, partial [Litorivivens sp.]|uniref:hypothetical protein n=1 Tax=Litorivivens sp. TaxID=2020868 RepID=UPI0035645D72
VSRHDILPPRESLHVCITDFLRFIEDGFCYSPILRHCLSYDPGESGGQVVHIGKGFNNGRI